jgi:hypothetical protein
MFNMFLRIKFLLIVLLILSGGILYPQEDTLFIPEGYLKITCSTEGILMYRDGEGIGKTPIDQPITVKSGTHLLSFFSPESSIPMWTYQKRKYIEHLMKLGMKEVNVLPDDTLYVYMDWEALNKNLQVIESKGRIASYVGLTLLFTVTLLLGYTIGF